MLLVKSLKCVALLAAAIFRILPVRFDNAAAVSIVTNHESGTTHFSVKVTC